MLKMKDISLSLQQPCKNALLPLSRTQLNKAIATTLNHVQFSKPAQVCVCMVDEPQSHALNLEYRGKDKPTNVLSFVGDYTDLPEAVLNSFDFVPLGDLVICVPVVLQEAAAQHKQPLQHFTHLLVHGVLHLLGYDHELGEAEAEAMEALEVQILAQLGLANPYA